MPSRNLEKLYAEDTYYHVYNRGVAGQSIFNDESDYTVFLSLFKRYLSQQPLKDKIGREYPNYHNQITLLAFCLMPNHYHLLVFQKDRQALTKLIRGVCTAYSSYFNRKYKRHGHLFENRYKAAIIQNDSYLLHISRYIHLNPDNYVTWNFSSLAYYLGRAKAEWLNPRPILDLFEDGSYERFVRDYQAHRKSLKEIKTSLADS